MVGFYDPEGMAVLAGDSKHISMAVTPVDATGTNEFIYADEGADRVWVDMADGGRILLANADTGMLAPSSVHLADLRGIGVDDLIVCDKGGNKVLIFPGLGDGRFGAEVNGGKGMICGTAPVDVGVLPAADGHGTELVVCNEGSDNVTVLEVHVDGNDWKLVHKADLPTGRAPTSVLVQDVNDTGRPDLVVTNGGDNTVSILPGRSDGLFEARAARVLPTGQRPILALAADFNVDGQLDLVTVDAGSNDVTLFANVASPDTTGQRVDTGGQVPVDALKRSVTGAGRTDLIVANNGDGRLSLLTGTGSGLQLVQVQQEAGQHPTALAAGAGLSPSSFFVVNEGQDQATQMQFDVPGSTPSAGGTSGPILDEGGGVPASVLVSERKPALDLQPLTPSAVPLVPTVVERGGAALATEPGAHEGEPHEFALLAAGSVLLGTATFLLPDAGPASVAGPGAGAVVVQDEYADVYRYILGVDEVAAPKVGPEGGGAPGARPVEGPTSVPGGPGPVALPARSGATPGPVVPAGFTAGRIDVGTSFSETSFQAVQTIQTASVILIAGLVGDVNADSRFQPPRFLASNQELDPTTLLALLGEPGSARAAAATAGAGSGPMLEDHADAPANLLVPERQPTLDLQPLRPAAVALVPIVVARTNPDPDPDTDPASHQSPDVAGIERAGPLLLGPDADAGVSGYIRGLDPVPAPRVEPEVQPEAGEWVQALFAVAAWGLGGSWRGPTGTRLPRLPGRRPR
jgi:hypothetical protein